MMMKIYAKYVPGLDEYVATVISDSVDTVHYFRNGIDLVNTMKEIYGVVIEYDHNSRSFSI